MINKKICYFEASNGGADNRVIVHDLESKIWSERIIDKPGFKFKKDQAAITLPSGDCLITGGWDSNAGIGFSVVY